MRKSYLVLILFALAITIVLLLTACSKAGPKGATGSIGPIGPAGQQGTSGAQGAPGPAGSQIFEGDGVPASALGNVGDYYINEQTDSLYGPKTLSGWGTALSLQGTAGAAGAPGTPGTPGTPGAPGANGANGTNGTNGTNGAAGSQILSGATTPTLTMGNPGDYYFDDLTDSLYGPKTSTGWGTAVSLRGGTGATGATGQNGATGPAGPQGPPGTANVIYYNWTAFSKTVWSAFDNIAYDRTYSISIPALTGQIVNQGVVLVYLEHVKLKNNDTTGQQVYQVPAVFPDLLYANIEANLTDEFKPGVLNFYFSEDGGTADLGTLYTSINTSDPKNVITESYLYRIILIPGGVLGTNVDPHTLTYKEVSTKFGIQP